MAFQNYKTGSPKAIALLKWLKLLTYIGSTVLLTTSNDPSKLTILIPVIVLLYFINYFRDNFLIPKNKDAKYIWAGIIAELLLIICVGFFDKTNINMLLFFVCVTSTVITYSLAASVPLVAVYMASVYVIGLWRDNFGDPLAVLASMFLSYGVATAFVLMMSYLVRMQIKEKERLAHMNAELEEAYKKLIESSAISQKLTIEQERTRMAREIHDTLAHTLTSLIIQLEACKLLSSADPSKLPAELEKAQELSRSGFNDVKRSIRALRPQAMEGISFFESIITMVRSTMENTKVSIVLDNTLTSDIKLSSHIEIVLFRVIQESITNSIRHGQAGEIRISIAAVDDRLQLTVQDNGTGCAAIKKGYGMQGIRERAEDLGGAVEFSSVSGKGFKTILTIPYEVCTKNENQGNDRG